MSCDHHHVANAYCPVCGDWIKPDHTTYTSDEMKFGVKPPEGIIWLTTEAGLGVDKNEHPILYTAQRIPQADGSIYTSWMFNRLDVPIGCPAWLANAVIVANLVEQIGDQALRAAFDAAQIYVVKMHSDGSILTIREMR